MQGARSLFLLLALAIAAGILLVALRRTPGGREQGVSTDRAIEHEAEATLGLTFNGPPRIENVSASELAERIEAFLVARFGPDGLTLRTRAFNLLGLLQTSQNLQEAFFVMEAAGTRGWFDEHEGSILLLPEFDRADPYDHATLGALLTRQLAYQHTPPTIGRLPDDAWIARRGIHDALAARTQSKLRETDLLPSSSETERTSVLLGLPMYLHNLADFHNTEAGDYVEATLRNDARTRSALITEPPFTTLQLLGGPAGPMKPIPFPEFEQVLLEESLGALGTQILLEWIDDFEAARQLARQWRGDHYVLFANGGGDHLLWICRWNTPEAAGRVSTILKRSFDSQDSEQRFLSVIADDTYTIFANCNDRETKDREIPNSLSQ